MEYLIVAVIAAAAGFALATWLASRRHATLNGIVEAQANDLRVRGRELAELRAAEQRRQNQRIAASKRAADSNRARAAARKAAAPAAAQPAPKPKTKTKSGAGAAAKKK